jgi:hypothetical protein
MRVKLAWLVRVGGALHAHPLSLLLPSPCSKVAEYAPAEWADTLTDPVSSLPIYVLWYFGTL